MKELLKLGVYTLLGTLLLSAPFAGLGMLSTHVLPHDIDANSLPDVPPVRFLCKREQMSAYRHVCKSLFRVNDVLGGQ